MYVSNKIRDGYMDDFYFNEKLKYPPGFSINDENRYTDRTDLLKCLRKISSCDESQTAPPIVDTNCLDSSVSVITKA